MRVTLLLFLTILQRSNSSDDKQISDVRDKIFDLDFVTLSDLRHTDRSYIHLAMIITNGKRDSDQLMTKITKNLQKMFESLFKFNQRTPLHLIVITDDDTRHLFKRILTQKIGKFLSETIIQHTLSRNFPRIRVEFTRLTSITEKYRSDIDEMKKLFGFSDPDVKYIIKDEVVLIPNTKYTHDLFFIAPFYHEEVTEAIDKLIVIDIDLEFRTDLKNLYRHFSKFSESELIGLGPDLSPHYYQMSKTFREKNPGTNIGSPGKYQVKNTHSHRVHWTNITLSLS